MLKKEARRLFKKKRDELTAQQRNKLDDLLLIQFQKLDLPYLDFVLNYYPMEDKKEINSFLFTDYLQFKNPGLQVAYPKIEMESKTMQAILSDDFEENDYGIYEPVLGELIPPYKIDLVIVPLFTFDKKGNRVGYGKGFYDIFLSACKTDCIKVGVSYFDAVDVIDDANEYDVPLNYCITPEKVYVF